MGTAGGPGCGEEGALQRAVELGVNFIDTADSYGPDVSEPHDRRVRCRRTSRASSSRPRAALSARVRTSGAPVGTPAYLEQQVYMSLRKLKLDAIDLWQLHRIDPNTPVEQSLAPIARLQKQGKIKHVGLSEVNAEEIERARKVVEIVSVQNEYNIGQRKSEATLEYCERNNIAFIPWFPVAAGKLAKEGGPLDSAAKKHGATVAQLSLAWLLHRSPVMLPIPGTSSIAHLEENMKAADLELSDGEWAELEEAAK